ncbi:Hsp20/alpha crystallin family protein [Streptomyces buecherae]|uniref:Hsp20 family protein n=1 Tax=Streptomyces buecherae TaxID=2763006 RepID=A0A7H8N305_9ACTN|nr:Hsp20 family protein [Streptomyces buecherae]QKW48703.1 Hsp20 family protein [Streptomyces buecherae]
MARGHPRTLQPVGPPLGGLASERPESVIAEGGYLVLPREQSNPVWDPFREFRVTLPQDTDEEHVTADLTDGVLTVKVPKAEQAKPRRIEIAG